MNVGGVLQTNTDWSVSSECLQLAVDWLDFRRQYQDAPMQIIGFMFTERRITKSWSIEILRLVLGKQYWSWKLNQPDKTDIYKGQNSVLDTFVSDPQMSEHAELLCVCVCVCVYIYIYTYISMYVFVYIFPAMLLYSNQQSCRTNLKMPSWSMMGMQSFIRWSHGLMIICK